MCSTPARVFFFLCLLPAYGFCQQIPAAQRAYDQGLKLEADGRHEQAAREFQKAIDINPEFGEAYNRLAEAALKAGKAQEGIKAYLQLIQLEPANTKPMLAAADAYAAMGLDDDALALYSR